MGADPFSAEQVLLKTSLFGGFEKTEVLEYIDKLRESNRQGVEQLQERMQNMTQARNALERQIAEFELKMGDLGSQLTQKSGHISELTEQLDRIQRQVQAQQAATGDYEREITTQREQNRQLALKTQVFEYKATRYDEMSTQLGDMLINAQQSANEILKRADEQAEQMKGEAMIAADLAATELTNLRGDIGGMRRSIEELTASFLQRLAAIDTVIDGVANKNKQPSTAELECASADDEMEQAEQETDNTLVHLSSLRPVQHKHVEDAEEEHTLGHLLTSVPSGSTAKVSDISQAREKFFRFAAEIQE